jgi:hypothetical protein
MYNYGNTHFDIRRDVAINRKPWEGLRITKEEYIASIQAEKSAVKQWIDLGISEKEYYDSLEAARKIGK